MSTNAQDDEDDPEAYFRARHMDDLVTVLVESGSVQPRRRQAEATRIWRLLGDEARRRVLAEAWKRPPDPLPAAPPAPPATQRVRSLAETAASLLFVLALIGFGAALALALG